MNDAPKRRTSALLWHLIFFFLGLAVLSVVKVKHRLLGYRTPKPFSASDLRRCVEYDRDTHRAYKQFLDEVTGHPAYVSGKRVLELGPGSDLGVGLLLLGSGAREYHGFDANDLAATAPRNLYDALLARFEGPARETLEADLRAFLQGTAASRLRYTVSSKFDLADAVEAGSTDVFLSQAAFEHFDDVDVTISQMSVAAAADAVAILIVDLQTHSRWIREWDPNNIYRFPAWLYRMFCFRGIPNRVRPWQYEEAFRRNGWASVGTVPLSLLSPKQAQAGHSFLARPFREPRAQMEWLTVLVWARRA